MARARRSFINYVNKKYKEELKNSNTNLFVHFDDYILWLWYEKFNKNDELYYSRLEDDMMEYSNIQTEWSRRAEDGE